MTAQFTQEKAFTVDWLSHHLREWRAVLAPFRDRPARILEIGSFEGRSAVFFLEFLPKSSITCIDTFAGGEEHRVQGKPFGTMAEVEARFDANMAGYGDRVLKLKGHSHDVLGQLAREESRFDIVYVDGDHHAAAALLDARLAWGMLEPGGVMILDDYGWKPELPDSERPKLGIDEFLSTISGEFEAVYQGYQIIIRRKVPEAALEGMPWARPKAQPPAPQQPLPQLTLGGRPLDALSMGALVPPLVSFVLINWNYQDYVGETIESIKNQDYPHFECLIVDNGSIDDSVRVIRSHIEGDPRFRLHQMESNRGQLGAAVWSLAQIKGQFVTFVDADDVMFPNFASTHLQVHLALPRSVSLTSSTVAEMSAAGKLISSRYGPVDLQQRTAQKGLRSNAQVVRFPTISDEQYVALGELVGLVPRWVTGWQWGPGTANMFRKSILDLVKIGDGNQTILRAADSHFNYICHALTGSALIDLPLSGYRIHGRNYFSRLENIEGLSRGSSEEKKKFQKERSETSEVLLSDGERFKWLLGKAYWDVLDRCMGSSRGISLRRYRSRDALQIFLRNAGELRRAHGDRTFTSEIGKRFSYRRARRILKEGFGGRMPARLSVLLMLQSVGRYFTALGRAFKIGKHRR